MHRLRFLALVVLAAAGPSRVRAGDSYRVEVKLLHGSNKEFVHVQVVDRSAGSRLEFDHRSAIKPYILEARKKLAVKLGYHPRIYGQDFHKIVVVQKVKYKVKELPSERVVAESD